MGKKRHHGIFCPGMNFGKYGLFLILLNACAQTPTSETWRENGVVCMRDHATDTYLKKIEPVVDSMAQFQASVSATLNLATTVLVDKQCLRRTYERAGYKIILFFNEADARRQIHASIVKAETAKASSPACLERAVQDISALSADFGRTILTLHKNKFPWMWEQPDIGPAKWLDCDHPGGAAYYDSLATLLHELNHELKETTCQLSSIDQKNSCFNFDRRLPLRDLARADHLLTVDGDYADYLRDVENLYLGTLNQSFLSLLEELNSYVISTQVYTELLKQKALKDITDPSTQRRNVMILPLFQFYAVNYLYKLKTQKPQLYKTIVNSSTDKAAIQRLLDFSDQQYEAWLRVLEQSGGTPVKFETTFHQEYLRLKKQVL